jgi:hypothetical protein
MFSNLQSKLKKFRRVFTYYWGLRIEVEELRHAKDIYYFLFKEKWVDVECLWWWIVVYDLTIFKEIST